MSLTKQLIETQGRIDLSGFTPWTLQKEKPSFKGLKAYVLPGAFFGNVVSLMAEFGFERATTVEKADVVVFTGGSDINPALYGDKNVASHFYNERDISEQWHFGQCVKNRKPMFGICRGAQFLHAMNGGKLWQDVNNHGTSHDIIDVEWGNILRSTSIHHQMLQINDKINVIAITREQVATSFKDACGTVHVSAGTNSAAVSELEIEAGSYDETGCFFVQGHPEVGDDVFRHWTMTRLKEFLDNWKDEAPSEARQKEATAIAATALNMGVEA
jgi:gamma-glutamyl-gamma-aminobutyrate hydrolase PuuD